MTSRYRNLFAAVALTAAVCAPISALAQGADATQAATEAYADMARGDAQTAIAPAQRAVAAAPDNLDYRLLLADALLRANRPAEAADALEPVKATADYRVQTRRAQALAAAGRKAEAAEAYGMAAPLATEPQSRAYLTRARIETLVELGRTDQARVELRAAVSQNVLPGDDPLDAAMLAVAVGDDLDAQRAFAAADAVKPLTGRAALDAGYSAGRLGHDAEAIKWFTRGLDTMPAGDDLTQQRRFEIRREIETLQRRWGGSISVSRGLASTVASATPGADTVTQVGVEAYRRLGGYNNGRPLDLFVRGYQTVDSSGGGPTGGKTTQGWVGLRWKPLSQTNLVLEASKMFAIGDLARDDVMLRAAWSVERGGDLRYDKTTWMSGRLYLDAARILSANQTLAVADAQLGGTRQAGDRDLFTVGAGVRAYLDSTLADQTAVGAGPRFSWRHWFGGDTHTAPPHYIDVNLGYDFGLSGDDRAHGLKAQVSVNF